MRAIGLWVLAGCGALTAALGCGGSFSTPPGGGTDAGSGDGGTGLDGSGGDASGSPCPATLPQQGEGCGTPGLECEYGANNDPSCDPLATCVNGAWQISEPNPGPECKAGGPRCPATFGDVPQGTSCADPGLACDYPQARCWCTLPPGPPLADGGDLWFCGVAGMGCPQPRPPLGSACAQAGQECDYGACVGGVAEACTGGVWVRQGVGCAQ